MTELYDSEGNQISGNLGFCQPHWDMVIAEVKKQGLWIFVAESGEEAGKKMVAMNQEGLTIDNFEPLIKIKVEATLLSIKNGNLGGCPVGFLVKHYETDSDLELIEFLVETQAKELDKLRLS